MNILVLDIGGTKVKVWRAGEPNPAPAKIESGSDLKPDAMVERVRGIIDDWSFERVSVGYPGHVLHGQIAEEPFNLGDGWVGFDFERAFGRPVRIMNDSAMQALGSYEGGRMLYLGLGTSIGTVLIVDSHIIPLALGHLLLDRRGSFEDYLSRKGLKRHGVGHWREAVEKSAQALKAAFMADYVVLGGGNAKKLKTLPEGCRRGSNERALTGGVRMWQADEPALEEHPAMRVVPSEAAS
jgi:predicted NBD/HSP70 family sugar kinase